jgi:DNA-binding CsgD family transcriptional regulator/tetratricopeptide (TPR) repeat protein
VRLFPLSRAEVAEQASDLAGGAPSEVFVDQLYARTQGNPFYVEQLMAAALTRPDVADPVLPGRLPGGLTDLLTGRVRQVSGAARAVLAGLAVAGRPLTEPSLAAVTELPEPAVRSALGELSAAKLLAPFDDGAGCRPRHALLAEAVTASLLPGERLSLHARTATVLEATGDPTVMAEVAGHWAAAGRPAEELRASVAAAEAALRVFAFAQAADLWRRAIDLYDGLPDIATRLDLDPARLHLSAIDALSVCGRSEEATRLAEQAYHRFAAWPDRGVAALVHRFAADYASTDPAGARPLYEEALRLFAGTPASREYAETVLNYANNFFYQGQSDTGLSHLEQALTIADAAEATDVTIMVLANLARLQIQNGRLEEALASLQRGNDLVRGLESINADGEPGVYLAGFESDLLLKNGRLQEARDVGLEGFERARRFGRGDSYTAVIPLGNAVQAIIELGDTAYAARLVDPLTIDEPRFDTWPLYSFRVLLDLRRGLLERAEQLLDTTLQLPIRGSIDMDREIALIVAEVALWRGRPQAALSEAEQVLARLAGTEQELMCGNLLVLGARAAADLAQRARAQGDEPGEDAARAAIQRLASTLETMGGRPFSDHPYAARVPGDRADWTAERSRCEGPNDPRAWEVAAAAWEELRRPHRAAYAWWRHTQARLDTGEAPIAVTGQLRRAATAAAGMAPLAEAIDNLARQARIQLEAPTEATTPSSAKPTPKPYGLTDRELLVLRLVVDGRSNTQIGRELYMSPKTASVHVSNILRKLQVNNRVQAAALAERAGLFGKMPGH